MKTQVLLLFLMLTIFSLVLVQNAQAQDNYLVGVGIYDITGEIAESNFFGYAAPTHRNAGIRDRQYARAFIMQEPGGNPAVFVVIDKGGTFQSVNLAVMEKLKSAYGNLYQDENVIISATHTHVSAGGFSHYSLYQLASGGFWKNNFDNVVEGIFQAIVRAHNNLAPGSIYINRGQLTNASINRSIAAYRNNLDADAFPSIDEEMTIMKFKQGPKEVGMISWFGVHPTNLSITYKYNSADNKGYAALKFERLKGSTYDEDGAFVAAFANSNAGDMSPNLNQPAPDDPYTDATGPGRNEEESANIMGNRQFEKAWALYHSAAEKLTGSIKSASRYSDFSNISIDPKFTDGEPQNTCIAALGVSFTAGAEDGRSGLGVHEGITKDPDSGSDLDRCQAEKPILLTPGSNTNDPATPKILPVSVMKIGQFAILAGPAEFTIMSGRRARATVEAIEGSGITSTILAGYSDAYAGYVTTREEFAAQHYEGSSTHFGPWTLAAYQQEFERLTLKLSDPTYNPWPMTEPQPPAKNTPSDATTTILFDDPPWFKNFGDVEVDTKTSYSKGDTVTVVFWGAHPNNDLKVNDTYLTVEIKDGNEWTPLYQDRDTNTKMTWARDGISASKITITWTIPHDAPNGEYRIRHFGKWKQAFSGALTDYSGTSSTFSLGTNQRSIGAISTTTKDFDDELIIHPNPHKGVVTIQQIRNNFSGSYSVIDIMGREVLKGKIENNNITLNLDQSQPIHFLNVYHENGSHFTYKLIQK